MAMITRVRNIFTFGVAFLMALASIAQAEAPMANTQVPGYYRIRLGHFEITALYDGAIELDTKLLKNTSAADLNYLLARMFVGNPKMQTAVNAYLINTGSHLVLVDAGAGNLFGPSLGKLIPVMAAEKSLVAGMHLPFPGIGHVRADGNGIYSWVPVEYRTF